jgi:hypothetical protein
VSEDGNDRNDEIWALASAGMSHSAIAAKYGISRARVGQIVNARTPAVFGFTEAHRAAVRYQESETLKRLAKAAEAVVASPPPRSSAIGKVVCWPDGHERAGEIVVDESVRVAAIRERRLISESYRRLTGTDLANTDRTMSRDEAEKAMLAAIADERARRDKQLADLQALHALPAPYIHAKVVP